MTLTKKQAAQLCIDALNSEEKLKRKVILVGVNIVIISGVITFLTSWYWFSMFAYLWITRPICSRKNG